jgi:hypothetical protein
MTLCRITLCRITLCEHGIITHGLSTARAGCNLAELLQTAAIWGLDDFFDGDCAGAHRL